MGPPRTALAALAVGTLLTAAAAHFSRFDTPMLARSVRQAACVDSMFAATPVQAQGPFYFTAPTRVDISEGRPGAPLSLTLAVRDRNCEPFPAGTRVSIWHTDASGVYSGFVSKPDGTTEIDSRGETFFRGELLTDEEGKVTFSTIVPGWYANRPVHIHVKVYYGDKELTTQLYFEEDLIKEVADRDAYLNRGDPDTKNEDENVPARLVMLVNGVEDGYAAEYALGIDTDASSLSAAPIANKPVAATPTPADGDDGIPPECLDESGKVVLESGAIKRMADVKVGDRVQVAANTFSEVFAFTHRTSNILSDFVTFVFPSGATLSVTPGHYVYVDGELVAASTVRPGATFYTGSGRKVVVEQVKVSTLRGLYNPQTLHGDIVVNDIVVSTYTTALEPSLAHGVLSFARCGYRLSGGVDFTFRVLENGVGALWQTILCAPSLQSTCLRSVT